MKFTTGTSCTNANKWICTKRQRTGEDLHHLGPDTLAVVAAQPDMDDLAALMARGRDHDGNIQPGVAGEEGAGQQLFKAVGGKSQANPLAECI